MNRKRILFQDVDSGPEWVVAYHLGYSDFDDNIENNEITEIIFNAENFDIAVRYAQQYLRKMQSEEESAEEWSDAQILSVELH